MPVLLNPSKNDPMSTTKLISDELINELKIQGKKYTNQPAKPNGLCGKIVMRTSSGYITMYLFAIMPDNPDNIQNITISETGEMKITNFSISFAEDLFRNYPDAIRIDKSFEAMLYDSFAWDGEVSEVATIRTFNFIPPAFKEQ